jgi:hypothetical protein
MFGLVKQKSPPSPVQRVAKRKTSTRTMHNIGSQKPQMSLHLPNHSRPHAAHPPQHTTARLDREVREVLEGGAMRVGQIIVRRDRLI